MCPGNGTSQCALGMELSNVPWEWDYPMYAEKELANVPREWDYNVPREWDKPMCPGNGTIQCALGMRLTNVPWEWD